MAKKRPRYITLWIPLFSAVIIYSFGDVLLKQGNMDLGSTIESLLQGSFWLALILSFPIIIAFVLTFASKMIMGVVLSKNDLGVSEGLFLALSVGILFILGVIFFSETANPFQFIGLILLMLGILLVSDREDYVPVPIIDDPLPEQE
jgi:multidrug transporter EmrE-like cation transporter